MEYLLYLLVFIMTVSPILPSLRYHADEYWTYLANIGITGMVIMGVIWCLMRIVGL